MPNKNIINLNEYLNKNLFSCEYKTKKASAYSKCIPGKKNLTLEIVLTDSNSIVNIGVSVSDVDHSYKRFTFKVEDIFNKENELHDNVNEAIFELLL